MTKLAIDGGIPVRSTEKPIVPLNEQPAYKHLCCPDCTPIAQQIAKQVMSLPMGRGLTTHDQVTLVTVLTRELKQAATIG